VASISIVRRAGDNRTGIPASGTTVTGGQVVEGRAAGRIGTAGAASVTWLGVALYDAQAPEGVVTTPTVVGGRQVLNAAPLPTSVALAEPGDEVPVSYAASAAYGAPLICAAAGAVTPAGAAPDARQVVGKCTEPNGVTVSGTPVVGLMRVGI
jgi:hypothetical protein